MQKEFYVNKRLKASKPVQGEIDKAKQPINLENVQGLCKFAQSINQQPWCTKSIKDNLLMLIIHEQIKSSLSYT